MANLTRGPRVPSVGPVRLAARRSAYSNLAAAERGGRWRVNGGLRRQIPRGSAETTEAIRRARRRGAGALTQIVTALTRDRVVCRLTLTIGILTRRN